MGQLKSKVDNFQPAPVSCDVYGNCVAREMDNMRYPMDTRSLHHNRTYESQTGKRRCYERNPINIVEGFGNGMDMNNLLMWVVVALIAYMLYNMYFSAEQVDIGMETPGAPVSSLAARAPAPSQPPVF